MDSQPQYQVVRQELWWGSYLALGFKTVFALLKSLISPTNQSFSKPENFCDILIFWRQRRYEIPA